MYLIYVLYLCRMPDVMFAPCKCYSCQPHTEQDIQFLNMGLSSRKRGKPQQTVPANVVVEALSEDDDGALASLHDDFLDSPVVASPPPVVPSVAGKLNPLPQMLFVF